jgi:hypothetical protein
MKLLAELIQAEGKSEASRPHLSTDSFSSSSLRAFLIKVTWRLSVPFSFGHAISVSQMGRWYLS